LRFYGFFDNRFDRAFPVLFIYNTGLFLNMSNSGLDTFVLASPASNHVSSESIKEAFVSQASLMFKFAF